MKRTFIFANPSLTTIYTVVGALFLMIFGLSSCSQEEDIIKTEKIVSSRPLQKLIVKQQHTTRTVLTDLGVGKGLLGEWLTTDQIGVWNITEGIKVYQNVSPIERGVNAEFEGMVNAQDGDELALFYPKASNNISCDDNEAGVVNIDFSHQGGTLESIANNLDLVYGKTIAKKSGENLHAPLGVMTAGHSIWNFKFYQEDHSLLEVAKVKVKIINKETQEQWKNLQGKLNLRTMIFTTSSSTDTQKQQINIELSTPQTEVYFVTPPDLANVYFSMEVIDKYGMCYEYDMYTMGAKENNHQPGMFLNSIKPGKLYRINAQKIEKGDYIEFDDTKWTTGNLIWNLGNSTTGTNLWEEVHKRNLTIDNYFVAPSQEWSPEQILNAGQYQSTNSWPEASPTPNSSVNDTYFSLFLVGAAGDTGEKSSRGGIIRKVFGSYTITGTSPSSLTLGVLDYVFAKKLYYSGTGWISDYKPISLEDARNGVHSTDCHIHGFYKGDLAYFATNGKYALPAESDIKNIFTNPAYHRQWGVIWVDTKNSSTCKAHNFPFSGTKAPIFGIFISKHSLDNYSSDATYPDAIRLEKADMVKGLFLPADGYTDYEGSTAHTGNNNEAGKVCNYISGHINEGGTSNGLGNNVSYIRATSNSYGFYKNGNRTGRYSIRPVLVE